jgi:hypothetical protein
MNKIGETYLTLWRKFSQIENNYMNAELLMIFAKFCDYVMCFELEAENLYLKGTSLMNSIKL